MRWIKEDDVDDERKVGIYGDRLWRVTMMSSFTWVVLF